MNRRELLKGLRATQTPERKRATAHHEAAHAAVAFMFGGTIESIDMRNSLDQKACVYSRCNFFPPEKPQIMVYLAGPATEWRLAPDDAHYGHWLEMCLDETQYEDGPGDLTKAQRIAKPLRGGRQLLRRMAAWTDEALAHPRLWAVVAALAEQLLTVKTRMSGKRAQRIMADAWGEGAGPPVMEMGPQWQRRFYIKLTKQRNPSNE